MGIADGDLGYGEVIAGDGVEGPSRGVHEGEAVEENILAIDEANEVRANVGLGGIEGIPPGLAVAIDDAATDEGDVGESFAGDEGCVGGEGFGAFPAGGPDGVGGGVGQALEVSAGIEMERDIAAEPEGSGAEFAGGDEDGSAAILAAEIDGFLDGDGGVRGGIGGGVCGCAGV